MEARNGADTAEKKQENGEKSKRFRNILNLEVIPRESRP